MTWMSYVVRAENEDTGEVDFYIGPYAVPGKAWERVEEIRVAGYTGTLEVEAVHAPAHKDVLAWIESLRGEEAPA